MSQFFRSDVVPLSGELKALSADIQRAQTAEIEQKATPRRELLKTAKRNKKRSGEKMSKQRKTAASGGTAGAARDRMISRHDDQGAPGGSAKTARARMIERGAGAGKPMSAAAARAAMIGRHDGERDESQQYVADMMRSNTGKAWEKVAQGETPDERLVEACLRATPHNSRQKP